MSLMPTTAAAAPPAGSAGAAGAQAAAGSDGLEQLFAQIMQQFQAALEQPQAGLDGSALPLDGGALPPELLAELAEFTEPLEGELSAAQQDQLDELMSQLMGDGLPQDQARELAQAALLLQHSPSLSEGKTGADQGVVSSDVGSVDELLALAERLRSRRASEASAADEAADRAAVEVASVVSPSPAAQKLAESAVLVQGESQSLAQDESQHQTLASEARQSGLSGNEIQADADAAVAQAGGVADARREMTSEPGRAAAAVPQSSPGVARADLAAEGGRGSVDAESQLRSGQQSDAKLVAGTADADGSPQDGRQDGRNDGQREQGLARWAELRDSVMAQGQKLAQADAVFKGGLASPVVLAQDQPDSSAQASRTASLSQLQQTYQASTANGLALGLNERFGGDRWTPAASQRILWMAGQNVTSVELRLDPPELGSLNVKLDIRGDQASLSFASPHAHVREVLEQQMPRLREMLAESGIELGQADVSDQSQAKGSDDEEQRGAGAFAGDDESEPTGQSEAELSQAQGALSLVDYYA